MTMMQAPAAMGPCELDQPIWAVIDRRDRGSDITYKQAIELLANIRAKEPKNSGLTIVLADVARRMESKRIDLSKYSETLDAMIEGCRDISDNQKPIMDMIENKQESS